MSHHSWLYCILVGMGCTIGGISGFIGYIWLNSLLCTFLERKHGHNDLSLLIVLGANLFFWCSLFITLACKGVIH